MTIGRAVVALAGALALAGCASSSDPIDVGLEGLTLTRVAPQIIVPGSAIQLDGESFVDAAWGQSAIHFVGTANGAPMDVALGARFVDYGRMVADLDPQWIRQHGGDFDFVGDATIEVLSAEDGKLYASAPLAVSLQFRESLIPDAALAVGTVIFVNDAIEVQGSGLLLGGGEGQTLATVSGCFQRASGGSCTPIATAQIPVTPTDPLARDRGTFPFAPSIAGIQPGTFTGTVTLENHLATDVVTRGTAQAASFDLVRPTVFRIDPGAASLGQYVFIDGGGFVGGATGNALTEIHLTGTFLRTGAPQAVPVDLLLIPDFVDGRQVRYVMSTDDSLGQALDLRHDTGMFTGTVTPITRYGADEVTGTGAPFALAIAPVRQVVYLNFTPSYVESLRFFGLRAVDAAIRQRILDVVRAAYPAVNIDFRLEPPTDFALYAEVEITGPDPNGMGLFGYDNSPGKDTDNLRLYDRLGGVNAQTQQDGFPGYGGVFVESLMGFSQHPAVGKSLDGADPLFDQVFDPFRPDRGAIITAADLTGGVMTLTSGDACPAPDRTTRIGCAVWTMGSLLGGTIAHEVGHSLGLANPGGDGYHDPGDEPNRLMDAGGDRPFPERAVLQGQGPAVFCDTEYQYLRMILPSAMPADPSPRPGC
ncbi:MAG: hypothetical protein K8W52_02840 [Deltaproteobacteria bacterium]|nr:hypothetical protein [Deltaproteobacteria bacterium]